MQTDRSLVLSSHDEFPVRARIRIKAYLDDRHPDVAIYRLLKEAIPVFEEHDFAQQWWSLLELTAKGQVDSPTDLLHFVPPAIRDQMINVLAQPEAH